MIKKYKIVCIFKKWEQLIRKKGKRSRNRLKPGNRQERESISDEGWERDRERGKNTTGMSDIEKEESENRKWILYWENT